jgi:hypothetical protein
VHAATGSCDSDCNDRWNFLHSYSHKAVLAYKMAYVFVTRLQVDRSGYRLNFKVGLPPERRVKKTITTCISLPGSAHAGRLELILSWFIRTRAVELRLSVGCAIRDACRL